MNIQSLRSKYDKLECLLAKINEFDILCFSETWLSESEAHLYDLPNYFTVPSFRQSRGGGTSIYIKNNIKYTARHDIKNELWNDKVFEITIIEITNILIACIYRSPSSPISSFLKSLETLFYKATKERKTLLICGDLNIDTLKSSHPNTQDFLTTLSTSNFVNLIDLPTRVSNHSTSSIDKIIINDPNKIHSVGIIELDISDHFAVYANLSLDSSRESTNYSITSFKRIKTNAHFAHFINLISKEKWSPVFAEPDVNKKYNLFINTFVQYLNCCFPIRAVKSSNSGKNPWYNSNKLKQLDSLKYSMFRLAKVYPSLHHTHRRLQNLYNKKVRKTKAQHYLNLFHKHRSNPRKTWKIMNNLTGRQKLKQRSFSFHSGNEVISDPDEAVNYMNKFFCNIGSSLNPPRQSRPHSAHVQNNHASSFALTSITEDEIIHSISDLKPNSSPGYDDITEDVLKLAAPFIATALLDIFNTSFSSGTFPSRMKIAKVIPIHKKGSHHDINNYRPISLLPVLSKCLEKIMFNRLNNFLTKFHLISDSQFGFSKNKSTVDAMVAFMNQVSSNSDKHISSIFCDLSKAFDCVNHSILLNKLYSYGIRGTPHKWFHSYLTDRLQFTSIPKFSAPNSSHTIKLSEAKSKLCSITCGVPQGSILGPLLFNLYINDLPQFNNYVNCILYADDTNIILSSNDPSSLNNNITSVLSNAMSWFERNHLSLNEHKTNYMHITPKLEIPHDQLTINNSRINKTDQTKFLGLIITPNLTWKNHILHVIKKINPGIAMLYKLRSTLPTPALLQIYFSLIHSHLSYAILIWGGSPQNLMTRLLKLQKKAIRIIAHKSPRTSCRPLFKHYKILTVISLYILESSCFAKKALSNKNNSSVQSIYNVHSYNTRQVNNIYLHNTNHNQRKFDINFRSAVIYNKLPSYLKQISNIRKFRQETKKFLLDNTMYSIKEYHEN